MGSGGVTALEQPITGLPRTSTGASFSIMTLRTSENHYPPDAVALTNDTHMHVLLLSSLLSPILRHIAHLRALKHDPAARFKLNMEVGGYVARKNVLAGSVCAGAD